MTVEKPIVLTVPEITQLTYDWYTANPERVTKCFLEQDTVFYREYEAWDKENDNYDKKQQRLQKLERILKRLSKRQQLTEKRKELKGKWEKDRDEINTEIKEPRRCPVDLLYLPCFDHHGTREIMDHMFGEKEFYENDPLWLSSRYVLLTIIHDEQTRKDNSGGHLFGSRIWGDDQIWRKEVQGPKWDYIEQWQNEERLQRHLTRACKDVRRDLKERGLLEGEEEGEQNTKDKSDSLFKKIRMGWIFKKTSHFVFAVIGAIFIAIIATIVVDILADLGLLNSIKAYFLPPK